VHYFANFVHVVQTFLANFVYFVFADSFQIVIVILQAEMAKFLLCLVKETELWSLPQQILSSMLCRYAPNGSMAIDVLGAETLHMISVEPIIRYFLGDLFVRCMLVIVLFQV